MAHSNCQQDRIWLTSAFFATAVVAVLLCGCTIIEKGPIDTVEIYTYRVTVTATQTQLASGCTAKDSEVGNDLTNDITAAVPLGEEYQVDLVPYWDRGSISNVQNAAHYCQSSEKWPKIGEVYQYPSVGCYALRNSASHQLVSASIIDASGHVVQDNLAVDWPSTTVAGGDIQRFTLVSNAIGPVWLSRSEGNCAAEPKRDLGLLTITPP